MANPIDPLLMFQIPSDGKFQSLFESVLRRPAKLGLNEAGVNSVTLIVPGAVLHESNQIAVVPTGRGLEILQIVAQQVYDIDVGPGVMPTDVK